MCIPIRGRGLVLPSNSKWLRPNPPAKHDRGEAEAAVAAIGKAHRISNGDDGDTGNMTVVPFGWIVV